MVNVRAGLPGKVDIFQRFTQGFVKYPEAMELVVTFKQIDALAFVAGKKHRLRVILLRGLVTVDGNESMRRENTVPEFVLQRIIDRAVLRVPPEVLINYRQLDGFGYTERSMAIYRALGWLNIPYDEGASGDVKIFLCTPFQKLSATIFTSRDITSMMANQTVVRVFL